MRMVAFILFAAVREDSWFGAGLLGALWDYLAVTSSPSPSDVIFVLAGQAERKVYGLQLFRQGLAPRLILSVGRFEVRQTIPLGFEDLSLRELTARTPPEERHFFIDLEGDSRRVFLAGLYHTGTYSELEALGRHLQSRPPGSLTLVSTSIHLRRIRWCCQRISFIRDLKIRYVAVPEEISFFRRKNWWRQLNHWYYVNAEIIKLVAYALWYRGSKRR